MKEKPILFSAPMVRAILDGRKTQTRRVVKPQPKKVYAQDGFCFMSVAGRGALWANDRDNICPYGKPGDRLWVRETWKRFSLLNEPEESKGIIYGADYSKQEYDSLMPWKPSIHMFRKDSRINLKITNVRVERLQEITEEDARAEGCKNDVRLLYEGVGGPIDYTGLYASERFEDLWGSINGNWDDNPWVWVVEFELDRG